MTVIKQSVSEYCEQIKAHYSQLPGQDLLWLRAQREQALERFKRTGFPSPREEEWKYTNVSPIERKLFKPSIANAVNVNQDWLQKNSLSSGYRLVFVDGIYVAALSNLSELPEGVIITHMVDALAQYPDLVEKHFGEPLKRERHGFLDFNTANFSDGCFVYLAESTNLDAPIELVFVNQQQDSLATLRNLIVAEQGAKAKVVESYVSPDSTGYLNTCVNEVMLADNARVDWYKLQCESPAAYHFGGSYVDQGDDSVFKHYNFSFGGLLVRSEIHCHLRRASECWLDGLYLASQQQHCDNHTRIHHSEANGISREVYKGILNDHARGVFQGRIVVQQDAQKTDSEMKNRSLLLSNTAEVDTKPQLEIYADDVKCAHGVTVGQLDDEAVYYLRSRCVDEESARSILTFAFANEMVEKISVTEIKALVHKLLLTQFPQIGIRKEWL